MATAKKPVRGRIKESIDGPVQSVGVGRSTKRANDMATDDSGRVRVLTRLPPDLLEAFDDLTHDTLLTREKQIELAVREFVAARKPKRRR